jgi:hypothetical protein
MFSQEEMTDNLPIPTKENPNLTENEWQIFQVMRQMKQGDQMLITKESPKSEREFVVRTGQVKFLFRAEIQRNMPPIDI